jgi:hypothetical protein
MKTINGEEFKKIFEGSEAYLNDITINSSKYIIISNNNINKLKFFTFINCIFNCEVLEFIRINEPTLELKFENCTFNSKVKFSDCIFDSLTFRNTKTLKCLEIHKGLSDDSILQLNVLDFSNDSGIEKPELNTDFSILKTNIDYILFQKINHINGEFQFLGNTVGKKDGNISSFQDSTISNVIFGTNSFSTFSIFKRVIFNSTPEYLKPPGSAYEFPGFYTNTFDKVSFSESNFIGAFQFDNCDFLSTIWFENCKNLENSELKFVACKFEKYSLFDNSKFNKIEILHTKFLEKASFENFETNYFEMHQVTFAEAAYFDDLNKNNNKAIENWDRKTLRAIKRELVNTHNQIDYLRFKGYELNAYKKEVDQNKLNWKDSLILYFNEDSNYFGLDWTKGIRFIFQWSFIFYLLYIITYSVCTNDFNCIPKIESFLVNYLKFTNPFSFLKPPFEDTENYFLPFLFFLLGKTFVSYGIYQTVQAFRKFGVNGG